MNTQVITQGITVFLASVTVTNLILNFLQLLVEESKKCSIMDREKGQTVQSKQRETRFRLGKKKQYAVLNLSDRIA